MENWWFGAYSNDAPKELSEKWRISFQLGNLLAFIIAIYKMPFVLLFHVWYTPGFKLRCLPTQQGEGKLPLLLCENYSI